MALRGFFSQKSQEPPVTRYPVPHLSGSMTVRQAWSEAARAASELDPRFRLTVVTSGLDVNFEGRSRTWEFIFFLPGRSETALVTLEADPMNEDVDSAGCILTRRLQPASPQDGKKTQFPVPFRDSPEVAAEFSAQGADFLSGPTDMKIEGRILPDGKAVWVTCCWDREYLAPFAKRSR